MMKAFVQLFLFYILNFLQPVQASFPFDPLNVAKNGLFSPKFAIPNAMRRSNSNLSLSASSSNSIRYFSTSVQMHSEKRSKLRLNNKKRILLRSVPLSKSGPVMNPKYKNKHDPHRGATVSSTSNYEADEFVIETAIVRQFFIDYLEEFGTPAEQGIEVAEMLMYADRSGYYSHGIARLSWYANDVQKGLIDANAQNEPKVVQQMGAIAVVDGKNAHGAIVAKKCTQVAIDIAREQCIGWVTAKHSNHFGVGAYYAEQIAKEGLIAIILTNTPPVQIPHGAKECALGTNPITFAAQGTRDGDIFLLDTTMTTTSAGKVMEALRNGRTVPDHYGLDGDGQPCTDPEQILKHGGLLPLGGLMEGYKGSGLSMMVDVLTGVLGGANFGKNVPTWNRGQKEANIGQTFVAVDPGCFAHDTLYDEGNDGKEINTEKRKEFGRAQFAQNVQRFLDDIRSLRPRDPFKSIKIPGERSNHNRTRCDKEGGIIYTKAEIGILKELLDQLNEIQSAGGNGHSIKRVPVNWDEIARPVKLKKA